MTSYIMYEILKPCVNLGKGGWGGGLDGFDPSLASIAVCENILEQVMEFDLRLALSLDLALAINLFSSMGLVGNKNIEDEVGEGRKSVNLQSGSGNLFTRLLAI